MSSQNSKKNIARILVYYRDLPEILTNLVKFDANVSIIKDGVKMFETQKVPRITIMVMNNGDMFQSKRMKKISDQLDVLASNNQIVGYKITR